MKFLYGPKMATILAGPLETKFVVHQALLCDKSRYFVKALTGSFEESKTGIVKLKDVSPVLFKIVVSWLYNGKIVYAVAEDGLSIDQDFASFKRYKEGDSKHLDADDNLTWPKQVLIELYGLADRLDIKELRINTIDALSHTMARSKRTLNVFSLRYISSNTSAQSPLRKLVVDHLAYSSPITCPEPENNSFWTNMPQDITLCSSCYQKGLSRHDIVLAADHPCKDEDKMLFGMDMCVYHEHADDEEKKACQASRDKTVNE